MNRPSPHHDPTFLGSVEDVTGPTVRVKLDDATAHGLLFVRGEGYRVGQVGSFVRIPAGYTSLFGIVSQVGAGAAPERPDEQAVSLGTRWLRVELVGEGQSGGGFERGIAQYPSIGDQVHVVTESDLQGLYAPTSDDAYVAVGRVASAGSIRAYVNINKLVSRHSAIVGSTGAGKSTAVASLLSAVSENGRFPSSRVVLLDLHGEYGRAFGDQATVYRVNPDAALDEKRLCIPFWALSSEELISIAMGNLNAVASASVLERVASLKQKSLPAGKPLKMNVADVTADTPLPFCIHQLWYELHCQHNATHPETSNQSASTRLYDEVDGVKCKGDAMKVQRPRFLPISGTAPVARKSQDADKPKSHVELLEAKLRDSRLSFLFQPDEWAVDPTGNTKKDLDQLLDGWIGNRKPITVFDLSGIPSAVLDDLVGALLRILYDAIFWGRNEKVGGRNRPLLLVLEEAHSYLSKNATNRASLATKRIAKEGRKYGVGLMLVSQRPSEIDNTILSQCGTMISLRLTNDTDRSQVRATASDNLDGLFAMLPTLRTGEALIAGEAVGMPVRVLIGQPPIHRRPDSGDPEVVGQTGNGTAKPNVGWTQLAEPEDYDAMVNAWRHQDPSPPSDSVAISESSNEISGDKTT